MYPLHHITTVSQIPHLLEQSVPGSLQAQEPQNLRHMISYALLVSQEYPMFHTSDGRKVIENLDEFDDAREVVSSLAAEYQACERPDYVSSFYLSEHFSLIVL